MKVEVRVAESFKRSARPLIKRYRSFLDDLAALESELIKRPDLGTHLGGSVYKIRLRVTSKGRGKSGGARVISLLQWSESIIEGSEEITVVNLLTVFDKSDRQSIRDAELRRLVADFERELRE